MKKIVILGSMGMAGHMVHKYLGILNKYCLKGISRQEIDIMVDQEKLENILKVWQPEVIINCIGLLVKESEENPSKAIYINSLFPHLLEDLGYRINSKIIHLSTD